MPCTAALYIGSNLRAFMNISESVYLLIRVYSLCISGNRRKLKILTLKIKRQTTFRFIFSSSKQAYFYLYCILFKGNYLVVWNADLVPQKAEWQTLDIFWSLWPCNLTRHVAWIREFVILSRYFYAISFDVSK